MDYKPDWDQAKQRLLAWWNHAVIDRCCIAVHAPRNDSKVPPFPDLQNGPWLGGLEHIPDDDKAAIQRWWTDPDLNLQRALTWFENSYFGGEALPVTYVNWGAMAMAAMFGSPPEFNKTSVWYPAIIDDWASWQPRFDPATDPTWQTTLAIVRRFVEAAPGKFFVGKPELGNGADVLSLLRGMDNLATDLYAEPEAVKAGVDLISDTWVALMEQAYQMTTAVNDGGDVLAWMGLWAPGRVDQIACDFSSVISPAMFRTFFVPEIEKMGDWCEYGVYHLDGPACIRNMLDTLLEIDQIKTIQFTPGIGSPPTTTEAYIPRFQRILEKGKNLYLLVQPDEVEKILAVLPPEGLYMRTYVNSEDEAEALLRQVGRWSTQRHRAGQA
ncbi:MAG: hypothetical protein IT323_15190 [Anaerolineae bacterium]|nr:hypothetical protein [Anaerolineae bacterium]